MGIHHGDLAAERERLIERLIEYRKRKSHNTVVVVFDGWKGGGRESSTVRGGLRIVYSGLGERADSVIKRLISAERREWIVVSSDREIARHAWATGSVPVPSGEFLPFLDPAGGRPYPGAPVAGKDEDGEEENPNRKGSARMPSKREKAVKRALGRL